MELPIQAIGVFGFYLVLNPMRSNLESCAEFGPFKSQEEVAAFYKNELAPEPYLDDDVCAFTGNPKKFHKVFKKGSPLEWCNGLDGYDPNQELAQIPPPNCFGHGFHRVLTDVKNVVVQGER